MDRGEEKALADIEEYGCHVIRVLEDDEHPPFTYTLGIERTSQQPELLIAGLNQEVSLWIANEYNRRVQAGERFVHGQRVFGFLEGFELEFRNVDESRYREYFGWALWLYRGPSFRVLQAIWPTTTGIWPWEDGGSEWYHYVQPVLDQPAR